MLPREAPNTFDLLADVVAGTKGPVGWSFKLADEFGVKRLVITLDTTDSYDPTIPMRINHYHPVPHTTYNEKSWRRWVFDQCIRTMTHELGETIRFGDDEQRPFVPCHGPGEDPYTLHEYRPESDGLTTQNGSTREGPL